MSSDSYSQQEGMFCCAGGVSSLHLGRDGIVEGGVERPFQNRILNQGGELKQRQGRYWTIIVTKQREVITSFPLHMPCMPNNQALYQIFMVTIILTFKNLEALPTGNKILRKKL